MTHTIARLVAAVLLLLAPARVAPAGPLADPVGVLALDTATGATCFIPAGTPKTYMGEPIVLANAGTPQVLTGAQVHFVSTTGVAWQEVRIRMHFWDFLNGGFDPLFIDPVGEPQVTSLGARQFITNFYYTATLAFATPIVFTTTGPHGFTINFQGQRNGVLADTEELNPCVRFTTPFAVGSIFLEAPSYGYYRNASGLTDFNFLQSDWRSTTNDYSALMIRLYARGPLTPTAWLPNVQR